MNDEIQQIIEMSDTKNTKTEALNTVIQTMEVDNKTSIGVPLLPVFTVFV